MYRSKGLALGAICLIVCALGSACSAEDNRRERPGVTDPDVHNHADVDHNHLDVDHNHEDVDHNHEDVDHNHPDGQGFPDVPHNHFPPDITDDDDVDHTPDSSEPDADLPDLIDLPDDAGQDDVGQGDVSGAILDTVPQFFMAAPEATYGDKLPKFTVIAGSTAGISSPNDLAFHLHSTRKDELWVLNQGTSNSGGSTVTLSNAGLSNQQADFRRDGNAWHFMSRPTSLAFGENGLWATGVGVQDANHSGGTFAGPSLWSSDMTIYAVVGSSPSAEVNGSHLDMLHGSPFAMGIAHDTNNVYWVYDGYHGHIARYDFQSPHYPGGHDHADGRIHRYTEVKINRHATLPSHMVLDKSSGWLYINDTTNKRILRMNTKTGVKLKNLPLTNENLAEHWEMHQVSWEVFINTGLNQPVGMALNSHHLFVSDHGTSELIAFDLATGTELHRVKTATGVRGITLGPDNKLWLANYLTHQALRLDPQ
ncbi:MAG: hypothetical protein H0U74_16420 [Bradymonadaceae bacterium]|nr:hypothetical protein [Lujinxingiaceae bacterium]